MQLDIVQVPSIKSKRVKRFEQLAQFVRITGYRESYYALIASYMDESFDPKGQGIFVVGGFLGRGVAIFELERNWEKLRKRPDIDIKYFKASECQRGSGEFAKFVADPNNITPGERQKLDSISHEFLNLIVHPVPFDNKSYLCIQGIGVVQTDFYDVIKDADARDILGPSPYRLAYDLVMIQCAWAMKKLEEEIKLGKVRTMNSSSSKIPVSFVCDEDEEHRSFAHEAYLKLKKTNPAAAEYMASFSLEDDRKCDPLQAADAAAFEIRRALNLALGHWRGSLRKQFNILADGKVMFLITHTDKKQLLHIVSSHKPGEPFKLDSLMETEYKEDIDFRI